MDYQKFDVEHFLVHPTFIEYCKGLDEESVAFWEQWIRDNPSRAHLAAKARNLYYTLNGNIDHAQLTSDYQRFKNTFHSRYSNAPVKKWHTLSGIGWTSIAACFILVIILFVYKKTFKDQGTNGEPLTYYSPLGNKKNIRLSDGSIVILNGGSRLILSHTFGRANREVTLVGEGYFNVVHDGKKPFIVRTASLVIKDLGTIFNVKAYPADRKTEATLIEGAIEVFQRVAGSKGLVLGPKKKYAVQNKPRTGKTDQNASEIPLPYQVSDLAILQESNGFAETDWTQEKLSFYREPFEDIAKQMERWYNVRIEIRNDRLRKNIFTASFDRQDIGKVLNAFSISANFNYRKEQNVYIIY